LSLRTSLLAGIVHFGVLSNKFESKMTQKIIVNNYSDSSVFALYSFAFTNKGKEIV